MTEKRCRLAFSPQYDRNQPLLVFLLATPLQKRSLLLLHCEPAEFTSAKHYIPTCHTSSVVLQNIWIFLPDAAKRKTKPQALSRFLNNSLLNFQHYRNNTPHRDSFYVADLLEEVQAARGLVVGRDIFPTYAQCALNRSQVTY